MQPDPLTEECRKRVGAMPGGKWRLDALIGVGGMAAVYAATHRNGNRAALKILHPEFAGHAEVRARFLREAYIANKIDHPGTVRVIDDDVTETGEPYLVMELLVGESVESRARKNGGWLRFPDVIDVLDQTLAVLEKAHPAGVVHRDLKPDNLFLTTKGEVKVLDFGIARLHDAATSKRTQTGIMMGTPAYMAPEQALGKWQDVDARTDLWSMGAVFFTLLSGRTVHEGQTDNEIFIRAATRPAPSLARVVPSAPVEVVRVVDRALAFERDKRFKDASSMREAVRALRTGATAVSRPPPPRAPGESATVVGVPSARPAPSEPSAAPSAESVEAPRPSIPTQAQGSGSGVEARRSSIPSATAAASAQAPRSSVPSAATEALAFTRSEVPEPRPSVRARAIEGASESFDDAYASDEDLAAMTELFVETERALIAKTQYGEQHPEAKRRFGKAFGLCASALMHSEYGLVWNVTPYSFVARDKTLWEPAAPFDRIPYQLFADGIRTIGLMPGMVDQEFAALLRLITLDRMSQVAPEDDFVTLMWDASFEHVVHQAIDTYAEGDQQQRVRFESAKKVLVDGAHAGSEQQIAESWSQRQAAAPADSFAEKQARIAAFLSHGRSGGTEARARAQDLDAAQKQLAPIDPSVLRVDDSLRTMLAARLSMDSGDLSERFVQAVARAFEDGFLEGTSGAVATPLRYAIDGLAKGNAALAIEMVGSLCRETGRALPPETAERCRANLAAAIVSEATMRAVLEGLSGAGADRARFEGALRTILGSSDATHFSVVLAHIGKIYDSVLRDVFTEYLARVGEGRENEMAELFPTADLELGLAIVRVLAGIKSRAAREAISHGSKSPHAVVRIEALGHVEGVSSERLRLELRALLEDKEPGVRFAALQAMEKYGIRVAGPFLVLRVRSPEFDPLPVDERRQAFATLAALAPNRAESVALEVAGDRRLVSTDAHEASRELATEFLGRMGVTAEAREALTELKTARLRNSDRVRAAAARALDAFEAREKKARADH